MVVFWSRAVTTPLILKEATLNPRWIQWPQNHGRHYRRRVQAADKPPRYIEFFFL